MLVLASASPRRRELLTNAGLAFTVQPADIDESVLPNEAPAAYVTRLAIGKAEAVFGRLKSAGTTPQAVLGADTTVTLDGQILGKPIDAADAARMLRLIAGRSHQVITGIALATPSGTLSAAETTLVHVSPMTEAEIAAYIATGEPMDKAGAYGIQGGFGRFIPRIEGCYPNVVGLPVARLFTLLKQLPASIL